MMQIRSVLCALVLVWLAACGPKGEEATHLAVAERFVDAFYSWQVDRLAEIVPEDAGRARVLYYQAWAEAGNYEVQRRQPCALGDGSVVDCAITVTDDIGGALGYVATDTFHLAIERGEVTDVTFTSDDPPILQEVIQWMGDNRPEVFAGPCEGFFEDGKTPEECVRAVVDAARTYATSVSVDLPVRAR